MVVTEEVRLQRAVSYLLCTPYSGGEIRWRASGVRLPASCLVRLLDCKRDAPVQSTNGQARRSASSHVSSSPACLPDASDLQWIIFGNFECHDTIPKSTTLASSKCLPSL